MIAVVHGSMPNISHETQVANVIEDEAPFVEARIIMAGSGVPIGGKVVAAGDYEFAVNYAIQVGAKVIVMAYTGVWSRKLLDDLALVNGVLPVQPHGSNSTIFLSNPPRLYGTIVCSGGAVENERSYGPGLEVFAMAGTNVVSGAQRTAQSFATPTVAGFACHLLNAEWSVWDARQALRQIASFYPVWEEEQGYGRTFSFSLPFDPATLDLAPPVDIRADKLAPTLVRLSWMNFEQSRRTATRIRANGEVIYEGDGTLLDWFSMLSGDVTFTFHSIDAEGNESAVVESVTIEDLSVHIVGKPLKPAALRTSGGVQLTTGEVEDVHGYLWFRRRPPADWTVIAETESPNHFDADPLEPFAPHQYRVRAFVSGLEGPFSEHTSIAAGAISEPRLPAAILGGPWFLPPEFPKTFSPAFSSAFA